MDQAKQLILGKWIVLSNFSMGQIYIMQGIGGNLAGQIQYQNHAIQNLTNVKIQNFKGIDVLTFQRSNQLYKAMINGKNRIMNGTFKCSGSSYPFNAYKQ